MSWWQSLGFGFLLFLLITTYFNMKQRELDEKLDHVLDVLAGLRRYLYEIDPQFDDERAANVGDYFADQKWHELLKRKKEIGHRTLDTLFAAPLTRNSKKTDMKRASPKERRDKYVEAILKRGGTMPTDAQIEAVTQYVPPKNKLIGWLVAIFLGLTYAAINAFSK